MYVNTTHEQKEYGGLIKFLISTTGNTGSYQSPRGRRDTENRDDCESDAYKLTPPKFP